MSALHHAYLIKGFLLAKEAPKAILDAIAAIIENLDRGEVTISTSAVPQFPLQAVVGGGESSDPTETDGLPDSPLDAVEDAPSSPAVTGSEATPAAPPKKNRNFSPETRAAAAERMRAMQARKKAEREGNSGRIAIAESSPTPPPAAKPYTAASVEKLIHDHAGYAGKRDPGQPLTDEDWPGIKSRLARSPDRRAIASDYDVDLDGLNFFIASCQRREGKSPGEALASPSGVASDAARPKW